MRKISTAVVVSLGFAFGSGGAFAQEPKITDTSRNLTTLSTRISTEAPLAASHSGLAATFTPDQLSTTTTRLNAAVITHGQATLGTAKAPTAVPGPAAGVETPSAAGNASLSIASVNVAAVEPPAASSMAGVQTSSEATGHLHAYTSAATAPVLGR